MTYYSFIDVLGITDAEKVAEYRRSVFPKYAGLKEQRLAVTRGNLVLLEETPNKAFVKNLLQGIGS